MNMDHMTEEVLKSGIQVIAQGARLTANLLSFVFSSLANKLEKGERDFVLGAGKEGQQKIKDLLKKHKDGVTSLEGNLTKEQLNLYKKEFKKLGVDFSVTKNDKDNYSFFFAGSQANVIEKALKNVMELNSELINDVQIKDKQLELDAEMNNLTDEEKENVVMAYNDEKNLDELTDKEKSILDKIEELDNSKLEVANNILNTNIEPPTKKQLELAEKLGVKNYQDMNKKEISLALEKAGAEPSYFNNKKVSKELLHNRLSELSDNELKLFEKRIEYENASTAPSLDQNKVQKLAEEYNSLKSNNTKETIDKINNLDKDIRDFENFSSTSKGAKLNANEILNEVKKHSPTKKLENKKENKFSVSKVAKIDKEIKKNEISKQKHKHQEQSL